MDKIIKRLGNNDLMTPQQVSQLVTSLVSIKIELKAACNKTETGAKFIDFFVHDILDFSVLNNNGKNFTKVSKVCDIRNAVDEIVEMQHDKINLKQI